ncbi:uncharacterized protein LOC134096027 [Sardina pilchardus]|uniref:uncharacterized protein LOC134096027 n=1 Tax=Sardina pilchardus TaxID=27697 RepID=UPI002E1287DE
MTFGFILLFSFGGICLVCCAALGKQSCCISKLHTRPQRFWLYFFVECCNMRLLGFLYASFGGITEIPGGWFLGLPMFLGLIIFPVLRCCERRRFGFICWIVTMVSVVLFYMFILLVFMGLFQGSSKEGPGWLALYVLLHLLSVLTLFKHPKQVPELPHAIVYIFGAAGLSALNSIFLTTELILKAVSETGQRTLIDLRVFVLPCECVFVAGWILLQIHDAWTRNKHIYSIMQYHAM